METTVWEIREGEKRVGDGSTAFFPPTFLPGSAWLCNHSGLVVFLGVEDPDTCLCQSLRKFKQPLQP